MERSSSLVEGPRPDCLLGILGGMGPMATAFFYQRVIEQTDAQVDQDHVPVAIWGDPTVPDRSAALIDPTAPDPTPWLRRGARALELLGADLIAVPCNSAHPFVERLRDEVSAPIVGIVAATVARAVEMVGPNGRVAVLSTSGTHRAGLYQRMLQEAGLRMVQLPDTVGRRTQCAIEEIKSGHPAAAMSVLKQIGTAMVKAEPDLVIAGCTEFTTVRDHLMFECPVLDSATVLAASAVSTLRLSSGRSQPAVASSPRSRA